MSERWRKYLDKRGINGAISADLSKAFDCILHDLAKIYIYAFEQSLRIIESFLYNREHRVKSNNVFSRYSEIIYGIPQGSIFNTYICDIFFDTIGCDIASYADDNTL